MLRRTFLLAFAMSGALAVAVSAGGAPTRPAAGSFLGTWAVSPLPGPTTGVPWANGGTLEIRSSSRSEVEGFRAPHSSIFNLCIGFDPPIPSISNPSVSAWYVVTYSWTGGGTMGGCVSNKTGGQVAAWGHTANLEMNFGLSGEDSGSGCWAADESVSPRICFLANRKAEGTTKTISEPAPGKTTTVESPALPTGDSCGASPGRVSSSASRQTCEITVTPSSGNLIGTTLALEGNALRAAGHWFVECYLIADFVDDRDEVIKVTGAQRVRICLAMVTAFFRHHKLGGGSPARVVQAHAAAVQRHAASGCSTKRIVVDLRTRKGRILSATRATSQKLTASSVRYGCSVSGGSARITLTGPSKGTLRKAVGPKLDLQVIRAKKAPRRAGKLSFTFGW